MQDFVFQCLLICQLFSCCTVLLLGVCVCVCVVKSFKVVVGKCIPSVKVM